MNSNFEYYKIFYYVAKYENLTKAAAALKTSQPAVTRTIHKLEGELGCRLFTRSKTGMKLTPEGRTFYGYVAAGCAQFFKGENDLSNLISLENGTIYISATETALHCYLFQAMEEFNSLYPNVRFKILNNSTTESVNAVKEGKVDLAFVSANLQVAKPLRMKILRKYRDILIAGMRFEELKAGKEELSLKELVSYPWISLTAETITRRFLNEYFEKNDRYIINKFKDMQENMIVSCFNIEEITKAIDLGKVAKIYCKNEDEKILKIEAGIRCGEILGFQKSKKEGLDIIDGKTTNSIAFVSKRS